MKIINNEKRLSIIIIRFLFLIVIFALLLPSFSMASDIISYNYSATDEQGDVETRSHSFCNVPDVDVIYASTMLDGQNVIFTLKVDGIIQDGIEWVYMFMVGDKVVVQYANRNAFVQPTNYETHTVTYSKGSDTLKITVPLNYFDDVVKWSIEIYTYVIGEANTCSDWVYSNQFKKINVKPTISILTPTTGEYITNETVISGIASDKDDTIQYVQIKIGSGSWMTVSGTTSWQYTWNSNEVINGEHTIYARSYDGNDYSDVYSVDVDIDNINPINQLPTVKIGSHYNTEIVGNTITISGTASDIDGTIEKVEIKINSGNWIVTTGEESWQYIWDTKTVENGDYNISVRSYDGINYSKEQNMIFIVENGISNEKNSEKTPGFEMIIVIFIITLFYFFKRRRINQKR